MKVNGKGNGRGTLVLHPTSSLSVNWFEKMEKYLVCFMFLLPFCDGELQRLVFSEKNEIDECVENIMKKSELSNSTEITLINVNDSLARILHTSLVHPARFISRTFFWPNDTVFNDVYVIYFTDYFHFVSGLDLVKRDPFWNPRAKFVIIIMDIDEALPDVSVSLIYNHIYDAAVITMDSDNNGVIYTFGIKHDECDKPVNKTLQFLARCSDVQNIQNNIYVHIRKTSLRGCHVKFISHNYWPFISFNRNDAIEKYLLRLIQQFENITVELINYGQTEKFGSFLSNFTYTGMLHEIEMYHVEGAVGGYILTWNRMQNLDFLYPYMVDHYKIVIARAKQLGKWAAVLKQLDVVTIWTIFITFCICCVVVALMDIFKSRLKDRSRVVLIVWGYFLNNITYKKNTESGIPHRLILLNILLYVFILSCATQASVLSATTRPFRDYQVHTVDEVTANYQLILSPNLHAYLNSNPVVNVTNARKICKVTLDCMVKVMNNDDKLLYTISSNIYHESYIWKFANEHGDLRIYTIQESVGTLLQTMYIRRGSSLAEPFNRLLLRARSGGLIDKFFERLRFQERLKYRFYQRPGKMPQSLKGLYGVFTVLLSGYIISVPVFFFEYLWHRLNGLQ